MSMATAAVALMGAGAVSNVIGSYYSAQSNKLALQTQASIAEQNARVAELGAQTELQRGQREEQNTRLRTAGLKSTQRTAMAANGIDLASGTAQDILGSTDVMGEIDANTVHANAVRSAWGYRTQATNARTDALMKRGAADGISPGMTAAGSLLSNAGQVASSWYGMKKQGAL